LAVVDAAEPFSLALVLSARLAFEPMLQFTRLAPPREAI